MNFYLRGGDGSWSDLFSDQEASACILVDVNAAGRRYCLGTEDVYVDEVSGGARLHFVGAVRNDPVYEESFDPFARDSSVQSMSFEVSADDFPVRELRKAGVLLQDVPVDVYWYVVGRGYTLDQARLLIRGKLSGPRYDELSGVVSFKVEDTRLSNVTPFPSVVATPSRTSGLLDEHSGKPYPVVIGVVKKLPLLDISNGSFDDFLVMHDPANEWPSPAQVGAIYDGDATGPPTENAEAQSYDNDGNLYVHVTTLAATDSRDITATVTGHTPATPGEAVKYLLMQYGDNPDVFDFSSTDRLDEVMGGVTLSLAFNSRVSGGVLDAVRDRLSALLPFGMVQRGDKYAFEPFVWDRHVAKRLKTDLNIVRKTSQPTETSRAEIFNSFAITYSRTGYRGDLSGCVDADERTNAECSMSVERYGRTGTMEVDGGDLADEQSARWLLNWCIETYSRMRVFVGYRCDLDAVDVKLWDTVMVDDDDEEWSEALFKVIKIRYGSGAWVDLDLVSVDDYNEVYGVNE